MLPLLIKEKVSGSYRMWALFLAAVQTIDIEFIKDGADVFRKDAEKKKRNSGLSKHESSNLSRLQSPLLQVFTMIWPGHHLTPPP